MVVTLAGIFLVSALTIVLNGGVKGDDENQRCVAFADDGLSVFTDAAATALGTHCGPASGPWPEKLPAHATARRLAFGHDNLGYNLLALALATLIALIQYPLWVGKGSWLRVIELERMLRFYGEVLGCTVERRQDGIGLVQLRAGRCLIDLVTLDAGLIATNTTLERRSVQGLPYATETGGLSGAPVLEASNRVIRLLRGTLGAGFPIIGVGGVMSGADARAKLDAGADLVQIYTGLIYRGPALVPECARALRAAAASHAV